MDQSQAMDKEPQPGPSHESYDGEEKKKRYCKKRNEPYKIATHMKDLSLDWEKMLDTMKCSNCHLLPNPEWRYLCSKGHQVCHDCLVQEELCPVKVSALDQLETGAAVMNFNNFAEKKHCCKMEIRRHPPDALYGALLANFVFKCPNECGVCLPGTEVHSHFATCPQRR